MLTSLFAPIQYPAIPDSSWKWPWPGPAQEKLCNAECPKCGSLDIHRQFHAKGSTWSLHKRLVCSTKHATFEGFMGTAFKDYIEHVCRCCSYEWETPPMDKMPKKQLPKPNEKTDG